MSAPDESAVLLSEGRLFHFAGVIAGNPLFVELTLSNQLDVVAAGKVLSAPDDEDLDVVLSPDSLVVCLEGRVRLTQSLANSAAGAQARTLWPGELSGILAICSGRGRVMTLSLSPAAAALVLDAAAVWELVDRHPALGHAIAMRLAARVRKLEMAAREIRDILAGGNSGWRRRLALVRLADFYQSNTRSPVEVLLRRAVGLSREYRSNPILWMLAGFLLSVLAARGVVFFIYRYGLESHFFNMITDEAGRQLHIHHFNYGLFLLLGSSFAVLSPQYHRWIRTIAFLFGLGLGLFVDEFSLVLLLDPDYFRWQSSAAIGATFFLLAFAIPVWRSRERRRA